MQIWLRAQLEYSASGIYYDVPIQGLEMGVRRPIKPRRDVWQAAEASTRFRSWSETIRTLIIDKLIAY